MNTIKTFVLNTFARLTRFDPQLLLWADRQEKAAREVTRQNAIEMEIRRARKESRHVHPG